MKVNLCENTYMFYLHVQDVKILDYVTGFYPTLLVQWKEMENEDPKPQLVVKWSHNVYDYIEEYIVYLNNWEYPIKRV